MATGKANDPLGGVVQLPGLPDEADDDEADDDLQEEATRFQASPRSWQSQLRLKYYPERQDSLSSS
jgi:hypothetical protein